MLSPELISILPASEVISIEDAPVPWSEWIFIVSEVPPFACKRMELIWFPVEVIEAELNVFMSKIPAFIPVIDPVFALAVISNAIELVAP